MQEIVLSSTQSPSRRDVYRMFDRIAGRYDLLNRVLSLGLDRRWRRIAVAELPDQPNSVVLDLACGTGDIAIAAALARGDRKIIAVDMAERMLALATPKIAGRALSKRVVLGRGDGHAIPLATGTVNAATIAFGIRNMADVECCLREMLRVVRPGGKAIILEFSLPSNRLLRRLHLTYIRRVVPTLGRLLSGDTSAYTYLNQTIETFPCGEKFLALMRRAGWHEVRGSALNGGIVTIYTGRKP